MKKTPITPNKFNNGTTKHCCTGKFNDGRNECQLFNVSKDVKKILSVFNMNEAAGVEQIHAKFLKEAADLSVKLNLFVKP